MKNKIYEFLSNEKKFLEQLPSGLCIYQIVDNKPYAIIVSDGCTKIFHESREEIIKVFNNDMYVDTHPDDLEYVLTTANDFIKNGENYNCTYRSKLHGTNHYSWLNGAGSFLTMSDGTRLAYITYTDITNIKENLIAQQLKMQHTNILLNKIMETTQTAIFWKDADLKFLGANKAFLDYYKISFDEIFGKTDAEITWDNVYPPSQNDDLQILTGKKVFRLNEKCIKNGKTSYIVTNKSPIYENNNIVGLVGSFDDVTEEVQQRQQIELLNEQLTQVMDNLPIGVSLHEYNSIKGLRTISISDSFYNLLGITSKKDKEFCISKTYCCLLPNDVESIKKDLFEAYKNKSYQIDKIYRFKENHNNSYIYIRINTSGKLKKDGDLLLFASYTNVDKETKSKIELEKMAIKDGLTGVYNRYMINKFLQNSLEDYKFKNIKFSIVLFDMDKFKIINDTLGHIAGDNILKDFCKVVLKCIRHTDYLGRFGGDEFILICNNATKKNALDILNGMSDNIRSKLKLTAEIADFSYGIAEVSNSDTDIDSIINRADKLLYIQKNSK